MWGSGACIRESGLEESNGWTSIAPFPFAFENLADDTGDMEVLLI
jgi:hypothetical protein